ncbi:MAG: CoxG family protein [Conexivisphaera sp.]
MHYEGSFEVSAPKEKVYAFITDLRQLTGIFPDVSDVKIIDNDNSTLKAKVGISFIKGTMDVRLSIVEKDPFSLMKLKARGAGLGSTVDLDGTFTLEGNRGTTVKWAVDVKIGGMIANVGSRLVDTLADTYMKQVISTFQGKLSQETYW